MPGHCETCGRQTSADCHLCGTCATDWNDPDGGRERIDRRRAAHGLPRLEPVHYTHSLQYQQRDGSWRDGFLGYTLSEARRVAREGRKRTGRAVRIVPLVAKREAERG